MEATTTLNVLHYIYLIGVLVVLGCMIARKDTVIPCIIATFALGVATIGFTNPDGNVLDYVIGGLSVNYNALVYAGKDFFSIIVTIAVMVAMSKQMADMGTDRYMIDPLAKIMKTPTIAYFTLGIAMFVVTIVIWPSPAVALIGGLLTPIAIKAGLPAIGAAIAMNLFGHGFAFGFDAIIQGAPGIVAESAGLPGGAWDIISAGWPIFIINGIVSCTIAYFLLMRDMKKNKSRYDAEREMALANEVEHTEVHSGAKPMLVVTIVLFAIAIGMIIFTAVTKDGSAVTAMATGVIVGAGLITTTVGTIIQYGWAGSLEKIVDYVRDGFGFGMKIFAPVVVIGGFFFIGGGGVNDILPSAGAVEGGFFQRGLLMDWAWWLAERAPLSKYAVSPIMLLIGAVTGLDGSGFSGLPLVGSLATSFGESLSMNTAALGAIGQSAAEVITSKNGPIKLLCTMKPHERSLSRTAGTQSTTLQARPDLHNLRFHQHRLKNPTPNSAKLQS